MRQALRGLEASRLWTLPWMRWKVEQNRHLARMRQAARQASGLEAMEIAKDAMEGESKTDTWPRGYGNCSKGETYLAIRQASRQASRLWKVPLML